MLIKYLTNDNISHIIMKNKAYRLEESNMAIEFIKFIVIFLGWIIAFVYLFRFIYISLLMKENNSNKACLLIINGYFSLLFFLIVLIIRSF